MASESDTFRSRILHMILIIKIEKIHNSRRFHRVKEQCPVHAQKIQNGVQLQGCV